MYHPLTPAWTRHMGREKNSIQNKRMTRNRSLFTLSSLIFITPMLPSGNIYKVNRCLARYSPRASTTNQPTNRAPNEPAMDRNANFGLNLVVFEQKILFFIGEIKSFVTHITENPPRHLVQICFWSGIGQNVQKMAIFGPKWPKMHILDQIWPFLGQKS